MVNKIVFGETTRQQAERQHDLPYGMTIVLPDVELPDWDLEQLTEPERDRFRKIALRWKRAYVGNFLKVKDTPDNQGENWLIFSSVGSEGDCMITTDHVHASEMASHDDIDQFVINAPEDVKWLLNKVLHFANSDTAQEE